MNLTPVTQNVTHVFTSYFKVELIKVMVHVRYGCYCSLLQLILVTHTLAIVQQYIQRLCSKLLV